MTIEGSETYAARLNALRAELARRRIDGLIVPSTDEHLSEYVGAHARRLAWLTGFDGSAGTAVVLATTAAIFVDGRYSLQARRQVENNVWTVQDTPQHNAAMWIAERSSKGTRIGYDPWLHTRAWVAATAATIEDRGGELVALSTNPIDSVWMDQPPLSNAKLQVHSESFAGKSSQEKRRDIATWLAATRAEVVVLCALDSIAWALNVRGADVQHTPVGYAFLLVDADGSADLFVSPQKLTVELVEHLGAAVRLHDREAFVRHLGKLSGKRVAIDPQRSPAAVLSALEAAEVQVVQARDPVVLPKAIKNSTEIAGHRAAQVRDGVALCQFLQWLSQEAPGGVLTELLAVSRLDNCRRQYSQFRDLSFDTILAFGANGSIVHYHPHTKTCLALTPGALLLMDSGGQYVDGTTDVTRTVAIGEPDPEMRERFTRVLKGHIALARAVFPRGTAGIQLDVLARQHLWEVGLDYPHGTGHGVGSYLGVHEGPHRITRVDSNEPLVQGMILSNEPGYYKPGQFGIRIENLMLVVNKVMPGVQGEMLGFEILTHVPIDRSLIDVRMLTPAERAWVDDYHGHVSTLIGPHLDELSRRWLTDVTRPLD